MSKLKLIWEGEGMQTVIVYKKSAKTDIMKNRNNSHEVLQSGVRAPQYGLDINLLRKLKRMQEHMDRLAGESHV